MATFASVNSFHYWLVIRRFLTCLTTTPSFTCWEICSLSESAVKTLGKKATPLKLCSLPQAAILFMETASSAWSCYDRHFQIVPIGGQILHISILEKSCCLKATEHGTCPTLGKYYIFWHMLLFQVFLSLSISLSLQIIKYFGHRLHLWPHTLGGICYRSKYLLISSEGKTNMEEVQRPKLILFLPG